MGVVLLAELVEDTAEVDACVVVEVGDCVVDGDAVVVDCPPLQPAKRTRPTSPRSLIELPFTESHTFETDECLVCKVARLY